MTYPEHPTPTMSAIPPGPVSVAEEALDRALDALVRGDGRALDRLGRLDPALAGSVSDVYGLADLSEFGGDPSYPKHLMATRRRLRRPSTTRRRVMTTLATIAATITLVVGLATAIPAWVPDAEREAATLAALDAPPVFDATTDETARAEATLPSPEDATIQSETEGERSAVVATQGDPPPPLTPDDCAVEPRSRQEVLEILSVAPATGNRIAPPELPLDDESRKDLDQALRGWRACTAFGLTGQAMTLETEQFIREDVYGDPKFPVAYSASTLNEILDVREIVDGERAERMSDPAVAGDELVAFVDPRGRNEITPEGVPTVTARVDVILVSPSTGDGYRVWPVFFEREDGEWRIRSIDLEFTEPNGLIPADGDDTEAPPDVELSAPGISWSANEITITQGGTIALVNDGSGGEHNFVIEGYNDDSPVAMPVGQTVQWTVPDDLAPGTYAFYCAIPGHRPLMEGTITITEA